MQINKQTQNDTVTTKSTIGVYIPYEETGSMDQETANDVAFDVALTLIKENMAPLVNEVDIRCADTDGFSANEIYITLSIYTHEQTTNDAEQRITDTLGTLNPEIYGTAVISDTPTR